MTVLTLSFLLLLALQTITAPPVAQNKDKPPEEESDIAGLEDYMEYHRYLKEVVNALESDPEFRRKLEKAEESDIRSGKIAEELEFVSHHVRTRLDEIKRVELNRLKELKEKQRQLMNGDYNNLEDPNHGHLDHANPHTFEIEDLKKLIAKTTEDLAAADRRRREEFKQYELQKEYEKQVKLNHTNGAEREKLEKEYKEREEKHKQHEKLHEPGHKAQLEEVWEEQDQMQQEFDPRTFFMLHDLDSNGLWDQDEVKALFVKELEKMYKAGEPEDDMRERAEEMERMRETVFKEVDLNRDGFIDYDEFLAQTKRSDFQQDHGWQSLDERRPYTDEELQEYIRQHEMQQAQYAQQGHYPANVQYQVPQGGYHQNVPQAQYHAGEVPQQQYHGQMPPPHPGAGQPPQQYHGQVPQPQFQPGQLPQNPPQQLPGNLYTNEVYSQHQQQQHPPQYQQQPPQYQQQQPPHQQQQQPQQFQQQQHPNAQHIQVNSQQNQPPNIQNLPNQQGNNQPPPVAAAASQNQNQINKV